MQKRNTLQKNMGEHNMTSIEFKCDDEALMIAYELLKGYEEDYMADGRQ